MILENDAGGIVAKDSNGAVIGEIIFFMTSEGVYKIKRTYVDPAQRGKGLASQLMAAAVKKIAAEGGKIIPACSYAEDWISRHAEYSDMIAK